MVCMVISIFPDAITEVAFKYLWEGRNVKITKNKNDIIDQNDLSLRRFAEHCAE